MPLTKIKLADAIERVECPNTDLQYGVLDVRGVNNSKKFIRTKANINNRDLSRFQIVFPHCFVFNHRTSRNGSKFSIAYNDTESALICTEDYVVFRVKEAYAEIVASEWLYLYFNRSEFDRYVITNSWGSSTEFYNWEDICTLELEVPPLAVQKRYISVYYLIDDALKAYIQKGQYLQQLCKSYLESVKYTAKKEKIGNLLREVNYRNADGVFKEVQGINISKQFMPSIADTRSVDLTKYKVVPPRHFACNLMHVGRDEIFPIALNHTDVAKLVSPAYTVLEVAPNVVPEYLMGWFSRAEFDRISWFMTDSSIRGGLDINEFYQMKVPIPTYEVQEAVANIQKSFRRTISMTDEMSKISSTICPILVSGALKEGAKS